ncbi:lysozyme inhibitor LprI family protein [Oxalicibacterium solurbis]|uniref:Lysozyme inhibitor LprI-like N-terminal domain-containing protein n=1 Tax=Oxalicibacterium solurbis TaxID=69280 RepID=A0A8J3F6P4_9BURK|nr:lysozyme inhibitor LprI family protein [Oxalicibacterium solurbis]GGI55063.1 hypothetical protein GCM10011430_22370 [Oxalicibacterium solurbis]
MHIAMRMVTVVIGLAAAAAVSAQTPAGAQQSQAMQDCDKNQQTMNLCAQQRYDKADAALNRTYNRNLKAQPDEAAQQRLREAQRAWISYRDKDCAVEAGPRETSGSIWPLQYYGCLERHTMRRTMELQQQACGIEGCR